MYEIFRQLLQERGVSAYRVAQETGIAQSVFSAWKNGVSKPKSDKMQKIADYFGVSIGYLYGDADNRLDEETARSDMDAFAVYLSSLGWDTSAKNGVYILSNGQLSLNVSEDDYRSLEFKVRNEAVNGILGFVQSYLLKAAHEGSPDMSGESCTDEELKEMDINELMSK